jgi:Putative adhesin
MPNFPTPEPVHILLDIAAGDARITTGERHETTVEVIPRDSSRRADVRAAEQTRVDLTDGRLVVRTPRQNLSLARGGVIDVTIAAPAGSRLDGHTGAGDLESDGPLGDVSFHTGAGAVRLGSAGRLKLKLGAGDVTVQHASGDANVTTGSGAVRIGGIERSAIIKTSNGLTAIGAADGDLRVVTANGDITVEHAGASVVAKTANGHLRVGEAVRGALELSTAKGNIEVGIAEGSAAKLDVRTQFGHVDQRLQSSAAPPAEGETLSVRGRTTFGDITIARAIAGAS